jgi:hypothetical protein
VGSQEDSVLFPSAGSCISDDGERDTILYTVNSQTGYPFVYCVLLFILFKKSVQICKIISHILIFCSNKINHNKIYDKIDFLIRGMI